MKIKFGGDDRASCPFSPPEQKGLGPNQER